MRKEVEPESKVGNKSFVTIRVSGLCAMGWTETRLKLHTDCWIEDGSAVEYVRLFKVFW